MSAARVINPMLNEFCRLNSTVTVRNHEAGCSQQLHRIKRDLFGAANPRDIDQIFNDELEKHYAETSKKWGFDFRHGVPLNMNNPYDWELVTNRDENYHAPPQVYTLTRAAHVPLQQWPSIRNDLLMDERAKRENVNQVTSSSASSSSSASASDLSDDTHEEDDDVTVLFKIPAITTNVHSPHQQQQKQLLQQGQQHRQTPKQRQQQQQQQQQQQRQRQKIHVPHKPIAIISSASSSSSSSSSTCKMQLRKRQPKITEYMKERKRLAPVPKKVTPSKRMRLTMGDSVAIAASSPSSSHNIQTMNNHSISFHFSLRSSQRHN